MVGDRRPAVSLVFTEPSPLSAGQQRARGGKKKNPTRPDESGWSCDLTVSSAVSSCGLTPLPWTPNGGGAPSLDQRVFFSQCACVRDRARVGVFPPHSARAPSASFCFPSFFPCLNLIIWAFDILYFLHLWEISQLVECLAAVINFQAQCVRFCSA